MVLWRSGVWNKQILKLWRGINLSSQEVLNFKSYFKAPWLGWFITDNDFTIENIIFFVSNVRVVPKHQYVLRVRVNWSPMPDCGKKPTSMSLLGLYPIRKEKKLRSCVHLFAWLKVRVLWVFGFEMFIGESFAKTYNVP